VPLGDLDRHPARQVEPALGLGAAVQVIWSRGHAGTLPNAPDIQQAKIRILPVTFV
jgi:hypothetical protein